MHNLSDPIISLNGLGPKAQDKLNNIGIYNLEHLLFHLPLRYQNKDSKKHEMEVKTCGSKKTVEFSSSTTGSVTIQTGCSDAIIYTECGEVKVKAGDNITIKDGCIKIN